MYRFHRNLPLFENLTQTELREAWRQCDDELMRRLMLEVEGYRRALVKLHEIYSNVHQSWRKIVSS